MILVIAEDWTFFHKSIGQDKHCLLKDSINATSFHTSHPIKYNFYWGVLEANESKGWGTWIWPMTGSSKSSRNTRLCEKNLNRMKWLVLLIVGQLMRRKGDRDSRYSNIRAISGSRPKYDEEFLIINWWVTGMMTKQNQNSTCWPTCTKEWKENREETGREKIWFTMLRTYRVIAKYLKLGQLDFILHLTWKEYIPWDFRPRSEN